MNLNPVLTTAGMVTLGLQPLSNLAVATLGDVGADGFVSEAVEYAPFLVQCQDTVFALSKEGIDGVFDYEVSEPFGRWYAETAVGCGELPNTQSARKHIIELVVDFAIRRGHGLLLSREQLRAVLHRLDGM